MSEIVLRPFRREDQEEVRALVLAGLADHFGELDPALNHDLDDIDATYIGRGAAVIVAARDGRIAGAGMLVPVAPSISRIVRMSVDRRLRGQGLGKRLVARLIEIAQRRGDRRILVETNDDWAGAIALYHACGFANETIIDGELHFSRDV